MSSLEQSSPVTSTEEPIKSAFSNIKPRIFIPSNFTPQAQPFIPQTAAQKTKDDFKFPAGGWECSVCLNYNFKGRKTCKRCEKAKGPEDRQGKPEHMKISKDQREALKAEKFSRPDWTCEKCSNYNWNYRNKCNRCSLTYDENKKLQDQKEIAATLLNSQEFDQLI